MNDVTIIGAGPAGSAAAILLARRGWGVALVEQHRFPRDKVCGECVSSLGIEVLERLGITSSLLAAGAVPLRRAIIHGAADEPLETMLPSPMLGISRHIMDAKLLDAARAAGVSMRQPARCEGIISAPVAPLMQAPNITGIQCAISVSTPWDCGIRQGVNLRIRDLETNVIESFPASLVLLADGKSALPNSPPKSTGNIGIKSHWINVDGPRDAIELFGFSGCYGGLAAIEDDRWNAAFSVPAHRVRAHHGSLDSLFAELLSENRGLRGRLRNARRAGLWLASPLPRFAVSKHWPACVIPLGNAAAAMEPIGGEGMGMALRSAEFAAEAIVSSGGNWTRADERRLRRSYESLWRIRRFACRATAMVVSSKNAADIALTLARNNSGLAALAMRSMGK